MFTKDLKKGDKIRLRNGWDATIEDNLKGNTRLCTVYGLFCTEMGSVYSHDIVLKYNDDGTTTTVKHTPAQIKCRQRCSAMGF